MKITKEQLKRIIKEELSFLTERASESDIEIAAEEWASMSRAFRAAADGSLTNYQIIDNGRYSHWHSDDFQKLIDAVDNYRDELFSPTSDMEDTEEPEVVILTQNEYDQNVEEITHAERVNQGYSHEEVIEELRDWFGLEDERLIKGIMAVATGDNSKEYY